jgi:nucleoside phosphorylase/CheY-like chemotaxis protein
VHVLIVEDDTQKYGEIRQVLSSITGNSDEIDLAVCASEALSKLSKHRYDLLLLDVNLPRRYGETPIRGGGLEVLREINRDGAYLHPRYVVGITAYDDVVEEFGGEFDENLWSLVRYNPGSNRWISQLRLKVSYIQAVRKSDNFSDGVTFGSDLAIISALDTIEFEAIRRLDCGWQSLRLRHDETRYLTGTVQGLRSSFSVVAAAAPRMGIAASSVLASKIIQQFRPKYISMIGICAGRSEKTNIGDIIVYDPAWDWGSGKIASADSGPVFLPSPHQLDLDPDLVENLKESIKDKAAVTAIFESGSGVRPPSEFAVKIGPAASGAAVVADRGTFQNLVAQHRGLLAIDMEAYGVATAANGCGAPRPKALIVKAVCDYADQDKNDEFQEYAADVSAKFLLFAAKRFF